MRVLVLSHLRLYPADNGARLRMFHLLQQLARQHDVLLLCPEAQAAQAGGLTAALGPRATVRIVPWGSTAAFAGGWLAPQPRDVYRAAPASACARGLEHWVREWQPDLLLATDPILGEFLRPYRSLPRVIDIAAEYALYIRRVLRRAPLAERPRWWLRWLKWAAYTRSLGASTDLWLVTAAADQAALRSQLPAWAKVHVVPNGVDVRAMPFSPNPAAPPQIAHCGALSYAPNLDALMFFCQEIWPTIRQHVPEARLLVTGDPAAAPSVIRATPGVVLTGYVSDIQAVLREACASIVPLRLGVGTRLKILEALAIGTPVVATNLGAEGLAVRHGHDILLADDPASFAAQVIELLRMPDLRQRLAASGRQTVVARYSWDVIGPLFCSALESAAGHSHGARAALVGDLG